MLSFRMMLVISAPQHTAPKMHTPRSRLRAKQINTSASRKKISPFSPSRVITFISGVITTPTPSATLCSAPSSALSYPKKNAFSPWAAAVSSIKSTSVVICQNGCIISNLPGYDKGEMKKRCSARYDPAEHPFSFQASFTTFRVLLVWVLASVLVFFTVRVWVPARSRMAARPIRSLLLEPVLAREEAA